MSSWSFREVVRWLQHLLRWKTTCLPSYWVNIDRRYVRRLPICCEGEEGMPWDGHPRVVMMPTLSLLVPRMLWSRQSVVTSVMTKLALWQLWVFSGGFFCIKGSSVRQRRSNGASTPLKISNTFKTEMAFWQNFRPWSHLKFDKIFVIGCTGICRFDNFQRSQWQTFRQNDIYFPICDDFEVFLCCAQTKAAALWGCITWTPLLTNWDLNEMGKIVHMIYQNAFCWMKMV